jgi:predicted HTH domain antitoxin
MLAKTIHVNLEMPEGISEESKEAAAHQAREAAILAVWERGELTIRTAAAELGLTYHEFLDLLADRGLPVCHGTLDLAALEDAERKLAEGLPA